MGVARQHLFDGNRATVRPADLVRDLAGHRWGRTLRDFSASAPMPPAPARRRSRATPQFSKAIGCYHKVGLGARVPTEPFDLVACAADTRQRSQSLQRRAQNASLMP